MRLLIAGAGDVGSLVARRAAAAGHLVAAVRRTVQHIAGCVCVQGDLSEPQAWFARLGPLDAVLWCPTPDQRDERSYRTLHVDALDALLRELDAAGGSAVRVILASSTAVYASDGLCHDESSTRFSTAWNAVVLREAERRVLARPHSTVARLGGLYGPGRTWLLRRVRSGAPVQEQPPRWTNRIHVEDAAAALLRLLEDPAAPAVCNLVDAGAVAEHQVMDWLAEQLRLPLPLRCNGTDPGKQVVPALLRDMGFEWLYPDFRQGYARMLEQ